MPNVGSQTPSPPSWLPTHGCSRWPCLDGIVASNIPTFCTIPGQRSLNLLYVVFPTQVLCPSHKRSWTAEWLSRPSPQAHGLHWRLSKVRSANKLLRGGQDLHPRPISILLQGPRVLNRKMLPHTPCSDELGVFPMPTHLVKSSVREDRNIRAISACGRGTAQELPVTALVVGHGRGPLWLVSAEAHPGQFPVPRHVHSKHAGSGSKVRNLS